MPRTFRLEGWGLGEGFGLGGLECVGLEDWGLGLRISRNASRSIIPRIFRVCGLSFGV